MILFGTEKAVGEQIFLKFGIYDKVKFRITLVLSLVLTPTFIILILNSYGMPISILLTGIFSFISLTKVFTSIKRLP